MQATFWVKRFAVALLVTIAILFCVELLKGHARSSAIQFAITWGLITAAVYTVSGYIRYRRNPACMTPLNRQS